MTPADVAQALEDRGLTVKANSQGWMAQCPAHEDGTPSLSVSEGHDGRVLLHCHAGCPVVDVLDELGLELRDLFADEAPKPWTTTGLRRTGATMQRDGRVLMGSVRYLPGAPSNVKKTLAAPGATRCLWPAPEGVPGTVVYVVEGEPDAQTAVELGLPAIAVPGADKWESTWAARIAAGRERVVIVADCDNSGRKAAGKWAAAIADHCQDVRILDLDPRRDDKYDLSDLAAGAHNDQERRQVADLVHAAAEMTPPVTRLQEGAPCLEFLTPAQLRAQAPPEPDWLLDGYIAENALTVGPAGKPKAGKSTLTVDIVDAITAGAGTFLGRRVKRAGVVYLSEEAAGTLLPKLPADRPNLHILTRDQAWPRPEWPDLVAQATAHALAVGARLLVVDTFPYWSALATDREKDAGAIGEAVAPLLEATRQGLAVLLPTHTRKGGGEDGEAIRGSSALAGAGDVLLELERPSGPNPPPRQRVLAALSRYPQTPAVLLIEHDAQTGVWSVIGEGDDRRGGRALGDRAALLDALPTGSPGATRAELEELIGAPNQQWAKVLAELVEDGHAHRDGAGRKGDPYRWQKVRTDAAHDPAQHLRTNGAAVDSLSAAPHVVGSRNETAAAPTHDPAPCAESLLDRADRLTADWEHAA